MFWEILGFVMEMLHVILETGNFRSSQQIPGHLTSLICSFILRPLPPPHPQPPHPQFDFSR